METINEKVVAQLKNKFNNDIVDIGEFRSDLTVTINKTSVVPICTYLKDEPEFCYNMLADIIGFDMMTQENRFGVVYNLYSLQNKHRLMLKTFLQQDDLKISTVSNVWKAANWHEREAFDMFGIVFEGHPDLRRIYMPEEFEYFPLRKDFPLMGIPGSITLPIK